MTIRGAKSYWGCLELISMCFQFPNSRWIMLRESMPTLKRTLLVTFTENFLQKGFSRYVEKFDMMTHTLTWNNGSQIIFMAESYDTDKDLNRFRGLEINGAFIDEVNEIREQTFNKVIERSGSWFGSEGCPTKILMSCNPSNNWVKERFYDNFKNKTLPQGIAYIEAKITDNPHIPQSYLDSLKMLPKYQYEVFVNGNWDIQLKQGGEFYKSFELDKHVGNCVYDNSLALHISFDENVNPYLPLGVFQIKGKTIYQIDEIAGINPNNTITFVCNEVKRKYPKHSAGMFIYGDATSQKDDVKLEKGYNFFTLIIKELQDHRPQLRVGKSNPSVVMRGNFINTVLEKEFDGIKVVIDEQCKRTINDFINTKESEEGGKNKEMETDPNTKVRYQKVGHYSDLFDYMITTAFAESYYKYQNGGVILPVKIGKNISRSNY